MEWRHARCEGWARMGGTGREEPWQAGRQAGRQSDDDDDDDDDDDTRAPRGVRALGDDDGEAASQMQNKKTSRRDSAHRGTCCFHAATPAATRHGTALPRGAAALLASGRAYPLARRRGAGESGRLSEACTRAASASRETDNFLHHAARQRGEVQRGPPASTTTAVNAALSYRKLPRPPRKRTEHDATPPHQATYTGTCFAHVHPNAPTPAPSYHPHAHTRQSRHT
jgi:hypothetical protein